jgi:hypothetical protein
MRRPPAAGYTIATGAVDLDDSVDRHLLGVSQVIVDPAYDPVTHTSDAALLVLSTPTSAPTVPLATADDVGLEVGGTAAAIAGWGEIYQGSGVSEVLQYGYTVVQSPDYCDQFNDEYDSALQLCSVDASYLDTSICNGDSGGPLLATDAAGLVEIGISSLAPVDCDTVSADYFTTVEPLSAWAQGEIQAVKPPPTPPPPSPPPTTTATTTSTTSTTTESASTSAGAPRPPAPSLPRLTVSRGRSYANQTLAGVLGKTFKRGSQHELTCARASATRFNCGFTFSSGPNYYYGNVIVYYIFGAGESVYWTDRYTVHWVNNFCYFHSGHRRRCKIHTRTGTS